MLTDDLLKDLLFSDELFHQVLEVLTADELYDRIEEFLEDLVFQLRTLDSGEKWRRSVTALVIRSKKRLREIEGFE